MKNVRLWINLYLPSLYRFSSKVITRFILFLTLSIISFNLFANNIPDHNLKAVYIFRFAFLTTWGEFIPENNQFNFCAPSSSDVSNTLQVLIKKKIPQASFMSYSSIKELQNKRCHLIYLTTQNPNDIKQAQMAQPHALLIGEGESFIDAGGMIAFIKINNRIKPLISLKHLAPTGLSLRSQLLSVSKIANDNNQEEL